MPTNLVLVVLFAGVLTVAPAIEAQPPWGGGGQGEKDEHLVNRETDRRENGDRDRRAWRGATTRSGWRFPEENF